MSFTQSPKAPRGQMKCNLCRESTALKNGDWFVSTESNDQQVFLCKPCESKAKGKFKRPTSANR